MNKDQSKPVEFLLSYDQLQKLANLPDKTYFIVRAVTPQGNFLVTYESDTKKGVALLQFNGDAPKILSNEKSQMINHSLTVEAVITTANKEFTLLWENSGDLSDDGKYTDQATVEHLGADGHVLWSYQNASISAFQGRTLSGDVLYDLRSYMSLPPVFWQKRLLVTSNGSIVVWGDAYMLVKGDESDTNNYRFGEFRTCLTSAGKLMQEKHEIYTDAARREYPNNQYTQLIALKNGNWLKIQPSTGELVQYDDHCAQVSVQKFELPSNNRSGSDAFSTVKSVLMLPNDQLLVAYVQGEGSVGLYVTTLDWKKNAASNRQWNQAIISPDTPESDWLLSYDSSGYGQDFMRLDLALSADQKSVFVSLYNQTITETEDERTFNHVNELYRVALPNNLK